MKNEYKLDCHDSRKSFYGKAIIIEDEEENVIYLRSYSTIVAVIDNGIFKRTWGGYSDTTMRHVNSFLKEFNLPFPGGKKWWESLKVESAEVA